MSKAIMALGGASAGALLIHAGFNFHVGSWWLAGTAAYFPAAVAGAVTALVIHALALQH